jgi:hypothetical protein
MNNNYYNGNNNIMNQTNNINNNSMQNNNFINNNELNNHAMNNNNYNNSVNNNINPNMNNLNQNPTYNRFQKFQGLCLVAKKNLENSKNKNHYLYQEYILEENSKNNLNQKQNFTAQFEKKTNDPNLNQLVTINISSYELLKINVEQITEEEKRTSVMILGTTLQDKGGEYILNVLKNFKMGFEEGQTLYDLIYIPSFKNNEDNKYFVVNFRKSSYIKNFNEAMLDYLSKNETNNNYVLSWYEKQGNDLKKFLQDNLNKKKFKGFVKYMN